MVIEDHALACRWRRPPIASSPSSLRCRATGGNLSEALAKQCCANENGGDERRSEVSGGIPLVASRPQAPFTVDDRQCCTAVRRWMGLGLVIRQMINFDF
jgi:hypothetical protein